ncbi:MAG: hypothetical protein ACI9RP_002557, partial [Cyclobacteriaceae bacterium]
LQVFSSFQKWSTCSWENHSSIRLFVGGRLE